MYSEAKVEFGAVLELQKEHDHALAHEGIAQSLRALAKAAAEAGGRANANRLRNEAEFHFKKALWLAERQQRPVGRFHTGLGWLYLEQGKLSGAIREFDAADHESAHFLNFWGKGAALAALRKYKEALGALRKAWELAPHSVRPPASEEIPRLIKECEESLRLEAAALARR